MSEPQQAPSPFSPFRHTTFMVLWTATVLANIGTWMYSAAAAWLMTTLDADPLMVSLVQVVTTLPMFLFALPAGALADIIDKRRFLILAETAVTAIATIFAALVSFELMTPAVLLVFVFLIEAAGALTTPAWQSIVPQLVPRADLPQAIAANSVGVNISRAVGPALGGLIIVTVSIGAPFWLNVISNFGIIGALLWWRSPPQNASRLPAERFMSAMRTGIRYARYNSELRATLMRAAAFFLFASAYWALLPLVARDQISSGAEIYGMLLGAIGVGAIGGAFLLPWLRAKLGCDKLVAAGTIGTAIALFLYGAARVLPIAFAASIIAGISWIAVLSSLNVSTQFALPQWVRGRGLAVYSTVFFGAMTVGSAVWGQVARMAGVPGALYIAAACALCGIPLTRRWKLETGIGGDLTPSMHWPAPVVMRQIENDRGPVLVTVEYRVAKKNRQAFLTALDGIAHERRRDGAYRWGVFEDPADPQRYLETFLVESWLEHLRQHERVTNADRIVQEQVSRLLQSETRITHLIAAELDGPTGDA